MVLPRHISMTKIYWYVFFFLILSKRIIVRVRFLGYILNRVTSIKVIIKLCTNVGIMISDYANKKKEAAPYGFKQCLT